MVATRKKRIKVEEDSDRHAIGDLPNTNASAVEEDPIHCSPNDKKARKRPRRGSKERFGTDQAAGEMKSSRITRTIGRKRQREVHPVTAELHSDADSQCHHVDDASAPHSEGEPEDGVNIDDESDELNGTDATRSGRKWKRSPEGPKGRGAVADRTCGHCGKVIVSIHGLKYHVGKCISRACGSAASIPNQLTAFHYFPLCIWHR